MTTGLTLRAARADNMYYPPDTWDPSKKGRGNLDKLAGHHPLGERAKRLDEGILVIRFENPYDGWCEGCNAHIARGTRYNADKQQVGAYFSTPIYEFRMKCTLCDSVFVIRTDPERSDYTYVSGIRRKEKGYTAAAAGAVAETSKEEAAALAGHAFFKLEHTTADQRKAKAEHDRLVALQAAADARYGDDYARNASLRAAARETRRADAAAVAEGAARGYDFPLLPVDGSDAEFAATAVAGARLGDVSFAREAVGAGAHADATGTSGKKPLAAAADGGRSSTATTNVAAAAAAASAPGSSSSAIVGGGIAFVPAKAATGGASTLTRTLAAAAAEPLYASSSGGSVAGSSGDASAVRAATGTSASPSTALSSSAITVAASATTTAQSTSKSFKRSRDASAALGKVARARLDPAALRYVPDAVVVGASASHGAVVALTTTSGGRTPAASAGATTAPATAKSITRSQPVLGARPIGAATDMLLMGTAAAAGGAGSVAGGITAPQLKRAAGGQAAASRSRAPS